MPEKLSYDALKEKNAALSEANAQLRRENERLRQQKAQYRRCLENLNEVLYILDTEGTITYISSNIEEIAGYRPDELIGRHFEEFQYAEDIEDQIHAFRQALAQRALQTEYRYLTKWGEWRWVLSSARPVLEAGKPVGVQGILVDITRRKQAEKALRRKEEMLTSIITDRKRTASALIESEQKYRDLVENAQDIFFSIDLNGRFIDVNAAFLREGSWSREDIIGNSFLKIIHPEDLPAAQTAYERGTNEQVAQFEIRAKRKDGSYHWYSFVNRPLYDNEGQVAGITGIARDIQARKQAEAALHRSEQRLRLFIDSSPDLIFLKDKELRYKLVNAANAAFFGYTEAEIIGETDASLMSAEAAEASRQTDLQAMHEKRMLVSVEKSGSAVYEAYKFPVLDGGEVSGVAGIIRDISDRRKAEAEREALIQELQKALAEVKTLSGLLPICSHCKKIKDDKGYWQQIENYIQERSAAQFTHGICKECAERLYPGMNLYDD